MDSNSMNVFEDSPEVQLKLGIRKIRNIEFDYSDCVALIQHGMKIPGTIINALGAVWQQRAEESAEEDGDWVVFSTWIGDIVQNRAPKAAGTIEDHVNAACSTGMLESLLAKPRWLIPLIGGDPLHWVLGWVDYSRSTIGIFNSLPELASSFWAEPLLIKVTNAIRAAINAPVITWNEEGWSRELVEPPTLQRQMDGWSCGLFVIMAMNSLARKSGWGSVINDNKDKMRRLAIKELLTVSLRPVIQGASLLEVNEAGNSSDEPEISEGRYEKNGEFMLEGEHHLPVLSAPSMPVLLESPSIAGMGGGSISVSGEHGGSSSTPDVHKRKRAASDLPEIFPSHVSAQLNAKGREGARTEIEGSKAPRKKKRTLAQRQKDLEDDDHIKVVEEKRVRCNACNQWVALQGDRKYDSKNWIAHRSKCSQISGQEMIRVRVVPKAKFTKHPDGVPSLSSFFQPKPGQGPSGMRVVPKSPTPIVDKDYYETKVVSVPKSIAHIFEKGPIAHSSRLSRPSPPAPIFICQHLTGEKYQEYILRSRTRNYGGLSFMLLARVSRQLFQYKSFPPLKPWVNPKSKHLPDLKSWIPSEKSETDTLEIDIPPNGNSLPSFSLWTDHEKNKFDENLRAWSLWRLDTVNGHVESPRCSGKTVNSNRICAECQTVADNPSFKSAVRRKVNEAGLSLEEQRLILERRTLYAPRYLTSLEAHVLQQKLNDPLIHEVNSILERGDHANCFLTLHNQFRSGKLNDMKVFQDLCMVLADKVDRDNSGNPNAKYGVRYTSLYLNFMTLVRNHGHNSAKQYGIIAAQFPCPSSRHLRTLVANSEDALQNPAITFENVCRVKRFMDAVNFRGALAVAGDCTKVRARLTYSTDFGSHILGSTLPLDACEVDNSDDIDEITTKIREQNVLATQVRAILLKFPLPEFPPHVIALIPTNGKETAADIHLHHMLILKMAANLNISVVSFAADGAASEMAAQCLMDNEKTDLPHVTYDYPLYGVHLKAPVFHSTGPVVSITDAPHGRKTCRNQPQHGTHTASLGIGYLVNRSLVDLYKCSGSGLVHRDVHNVDKQDDGAARRLFHETALRAATDEGSNDDERKIKEGFHGIFVYLFIFGTLFDAWLSRTMSIKDRILAAFRARFFLHMWRQHIIKMMKQFPDLYSTTRSFISPASFHIFNRLCDSLVLLAIVYVRYYPTQPFCPWLLGTEFVEHFFGLARMLLPNFSYGEFLKMVKHMMVRQRLLLSGKFPQKLERQSASGYIMDYDATPIGPEEAQLSTVNITDNIIGEIVVLGFNEAYRICRDILHIPASLPTATAPINLVALGAHIPKPKPKAKAKTTDEDSDNSDTESDCDILEDDLDNETSPNDGAPNDITRIADHTAGAAKDTARYAALCDEYDAIAGVEASSGPATPPKIPIIPPTSAYLGILEPSKSQIIDGTGKVSIQLMLSYRERLQSGTTAHSERVVKVNPKFNIQASAK